jgi:hypothetical protein
MRATRDCDRDLGGLLEVCSQAHNRGPRRATLSIGTGGHLPRRWKVRTFGSRAVLVLDNQRKIS